METTLLFHRGIELPCFATFPLLASSEGTAELRRYFEPHVALAAERGLTAVLDTPTWRANADWGAKLGCDAGDLAEANRKAVALLDGVRDPPAERERRRRLLRHRPPPRRRDRRRLALGGVASSGRRNGSLRPEGPSRAARPARARARSRTPRRA
jgi:hypothetical protein